MIYLKLHLKYLLMYYFLEQGRLVNLKIEGSGESRGLVNVIVRKSKNKYSGDNDYSPL